MKSLRSPQDIETLPFLEAHPCAAFVSREVATG